MRHPSESEIGGRDDRTQFKALGLRSGENLTQRPPIVESELLHTAVGDAD